VVVGTISLLAQVYAIASMETDWGMGRFYALMGFFESAIMAIAFSDSLFLSYALLEMLTLSTYLLVGFWYAQPAVVTAARDAFWTKRLGDLLLLMAVVALSSLAPSLNFSDLEVWAGLPSTIDYFQGHSWVATLLGLGLIAGPTGKCAQFPLHLWLDEAMEGPNPASILRNSAVVAAGAYVLIKLQPVLALSPIASSVLIVLGTITAVGASWVAIAQIDIKRAFSHSTSAYLGLVFIAVGLREPQVALSFLFTHAIARALLFMATGAIMLFTFTQDLTEMGGLGGKMPATVTAYGVGALASVAVLPLGNFWTMLNWLEVIAQRLPILVPVVLMVNGVTAFGLVRVFDLVFLGQPKPRTRRVTEVPWTAAVPMLSLTVINLLVPIVLFAWQLLPHLDLANYGAIMLLVGSGGLGMGIAAWIYIKEYAEGSTVPMPPRLFLQLKKPVQDFFANDLNVREIYKYTIVLVISTSARTLSWIDKNLVDGFANFLGIASIFSGQSLRYTITGRSQQYILTILIGTLLVALISYW
jgi:NAD(P)H-quinone oxidoreductase subunit 5